MKLSETEVDVAKETAGDWVSWPSHPEVKAHVRSITNPDYRRAMQVELQKLRRKFGNEPVPPETQDKITAKLMVDHVLGDLTGLEDDDGSEIKYDREFGLTILTDPKYRKLADFISWASGVVGEQETEQAEDDAKNSGTASTGKHRGGGTSKPS